MNCRACEYALWNLPGRTCPECGTPFRPSEFDFVPNSVRFLCPHCGQPYYGTDARGHLVPDEFACVRCAEPLHMDQMVLLPAEGVEDRATVPYRLPWADRAALGFPRAWLRTIAMAVLSPTRLMRAARDTGPGSACWFAFMTWAVAVVGGISPVLIWFFARPMNVRPAGLSSFGLPIVVWGMIWAALVAVWGLIAHGILVATGATAGRIGRTYTAILFASAISIIGAVPCLGAYLMMMVIPLWWAVLAAIMLREAHKVSAWRATIAGLLPPVLAYLAVALLWVAIIAASMQRMTAAAQAARAAQAAAARTAQQPSLASRRTADLVRAIKDWAEPLGETPRHAARLVASERLDAADLCLQTVTGTSPWDVPMGPMTLGDFDGMTKSERLDATQALESLLPRSVVAHRLGDYVFVHHGIDMSRADPGLWLVIFHPRPGSMAPRPDLPVTLVMGLADGSTAECSPQALAVALARQNALRAGLGLPPLPDPATVTEDNPATRPP